MEPQESLSQLINRIIFQSALSMVNAGDLTEAERFLLLTPDPVPCEHRHLLGKVYAQQGKYGEAIAEWHKVLAETPDHREAAEAIRKADELLRDPAAHPVRVFRRRLVQFGQVAVLIAVLASIFFNVRLVRRAHSLEEELVGTKTRLEQRLDSLRLDRNQAAAIINRLSTDGRLAGFDIHVEREGAHVWCSGGVPSLHLKAVVGLVARSVEGVRSVDVTSVEVTHSYKTRPDDILTAVSARVYGDASRWHEIHLANRSRLSDPDVLAPGTILRIP